MTMQIVESTGGILSCHIPQHCCPSWVHIYPLSNTSLTTRSSTTANTNITVQEHKHNTTTSNHNIICHNYKHTQKYQTLKDTSKRGEVIHSRVHNYPQALGSSVLGHLLSGVLLLCRGSHCCHLTKGSSRLTCFECHHATTMKPAQQRRDACTSESQKYKKVIKILGIIILNNGHLSCVNKNIDPIFLMKIQRMNYTQASHGSRGLWGGWVC